MKFLLLFILLTTTSIAQGRNFDNVTIKTQQLTNSIYMLQGSGGNIGLSIGDDGVFMIDDQFAPLHTKIKAAIGAISDQPVRFLLNTHFHNDHTSGNTAFGKLGANILAQENVRPRIQKAQKLADGAKGLPVLTYPNSITLHINGDTVIVRHYPHAHTDGDSAVYFETANVIHTGDLFFHGRYPFIDIKNGGNIKGVIAALTDIIARADADTKIIPGHGALANKAAIEKDLTIIKTITASIQTHIDAGKTLAQVVAAKPSAPFDKTHSNGFINGDKLVTDIYLSLAE